MKYETTKCEACGSITSNIDAMLNALEKTIVKPKGFELYDFGEGTLVAPVPDPKGDSYLIAHMLGVVKKGECKVTCFSFDLNELSADTLAVMAEKAMEHNSTQTKKFEILS